MQPERRSCGAFAALLSMTSRAALGPRTAGENVSRSSVEVPAVIVIGGKPELRKARSSLPVTVTLLTTMVARLVLISRTGSSREVPTTT